MQQTNMSTHNVSDERANLHPQPLLLSHCGPTASLFLCNMRAIHGAQQHEQRVAQQAHEPVVRVEVPAASANARLAISKWDCTILQGQFVWKGRVWTRCMVHHNGQQLHLGERASRQELRAQGSLHCRRREGRRRSLCSAREVEPRWATRGGSAIAHRL
jgi:hypothetical protein